MPTRHSWLSFGFADPHYAALDRAHRAEELQSFIFIPLTRAIAIGIGVELQVQGPAIPQMGQSVGHEELPLRDAPLIRLTMAVEANPKGSNEIEVAEGKIHRDVALYE